MSIIKGKTNVVAGYGGTKRNLGEVYFSQSSLASDNSGALPAWTGEYYENGKTLFPDLYNFVKARSWLQVTKTEYDNAITTYGECPKYVIDENGTEEDQVVPRYVWIDNDTASDDVHEVYVTKNRNPVVGDSVWHYNSETLEENITDFTNDTPDYTISKVSGNTIIIRQEITATFSEEQADKGTITVTANGTSLRLPKYANYIKCANGTDGITQSKAGLPTVKAISNTAAASVADFSSLPSYAKPVQNTQSYALMTGASISRVNSLVYVENDASIDSAIYGASDTVTPAHTTLYPWITAYTSAIPASIAQAAEFTGALSGKANTDLSNVPTGYDYVIEYAVNSDGSWYRKYKSGWLEQGGQYRTTAIRQMYATITFPKEFATTNYSMHVTPHSPARTTQYLTWMGMPSIGGETTTSVYVGVYGISEQDAMDGFDWRAEGQGAN